MEIATLMINALGAIAIPAVILLAILRFFEQRVWSVIERTMQRQADEMGRIARLLDETSKRLGEIEQRLDRHELKIEMLEKGDDKPKSGTRRRRIAKR